jgi:hypothetical protein
MQSVCNVILSLSNAYRDLNLFRFIYCAYSRYFPSFLCLPSFPSVSTGDSVNIVYVFYVTIECEDNGADITRQILPTI